jgi:hypothetical protein
VQQHPGAPDGHRLAFGLAIRFGRESGAREVDFTRVFEQAAADAGVALVCCGRLPFFGREGESGMRFEVDQIGTY